MFCYNLASISFFKRWRIAYKGCFVGQSVAFFLSVVLQNVMKNLKSRFCKYMAVDQAVISKQWLKGDYIKTTKTKYMEKLVQQYLAHQKNRQCIWGCYPWVWRCRKGKIYLFKRYNISPLFQELFKWGRVAYIGGVVGRTVGLSVFKIFWKSLK